VGVEGGEGEGRGGGIIDDGSASAGGKNSKRNGFHSAVAAEGSFLAELQAETSRIGREVAACANNLWQEISDTLARLATQVCPAIPDCLSFALKLGMAASGLGVGGGHGGDVMEASGQHLLRC